MTTHRIISSKALKSQVLDDHLKKVNARYGFNLTFDNSIKINTFSEKQCKPSKNMVASQIHDVFYDLSDDLDKNRPIICKENEIITKNVWSKIKLDQVRNVIRIGMIK